MPEDSDITPGEEQSPEEPTPTPEGEASADEPSSEQPEATPDEASEGEGSPQGNDGDDEYYSTNAENDEESEALRVAQMAMAALQDDEAGDGDSAEDATLSNDEIDALAAAQAALGELNDEASSAVSTDAASADDEAEAAMMAAMGGGGGGGAAASGAESFQWQDLSTGAEAAAPEKIDLLGDVNLNVKIELGRTRMLVEDVLRLDKGAVVELDKLAGDPVDVYVNGQPVARGEVLVLNDNFCVRINEILTVAQAETLRERA